MKLVQQAIATLTILAAATATSALVFAYLASAIGNRPLPTAQGSPSPLPEPSIPLAPPSPTSDPIGLRPKPSLGSPISSPSSPGSSPSPTSSPSSGNTGVAAKVEERIKTFFAERTGVAVQSVKCPAEIKTTAGSSFTCDTSAEGITFPVNVNITNAQGDFRVDVKGLMILARLEQQIQETVKQKTGIDVKADCGARLRITKAGENFQCQLISPQGTQPVEVTVEDDQGRVRWKL